MNKGNEEEMRMPQIEFGTKITSPISQPTFVFASLWPSWLYAAKASGYSNVIAYVEDEKPGVKEIVEATLPTGGQLVSLSGWKSRLQERVQQETSEQVLILFQGPRDALNRVLDFMRELTGGTRQVAIMSFVTIEKEGRRAAKKRQRLMRSMDVSPIAVISHKAVGGVVDQSWTLNSNVTGLMSARARLERQSRVQAVLSDYLVHTLPGQRLVSTDREGNSSLTGVTWKRRRFAVDTRSVFSTTGWVRRDISVNELMDVYDVGVGDRNVMKDILAQTNHDSFPLEFTQQVPVRVLMRCLEVLNSIEANQPDPLGGIDAPRARTRKAEVDDSLEHSLMKRLKLSADVGLAKGISEGDKLQTKNDDATAQVSNWNKRVCDRIGCEYQPEKHDGALDSLRDLSLRWYRSYKGGVIRSFRRYMSGEYGAEWLLQVHMFFSTKKSRAQEVSSELIKDYEVGMDAIERALGASFWEWDEGSTVFFWRWTAEHKKEIRDGLRVWFRRSELPGYWGRQRWPQDELQREQLQNKICKVVRRRYVSEGFVKSLTGFFAVPKGVGDIRVVYDATKSGLNEAIWAPNFFLPTISSVLNNADDNTFYGDIDIGEMFLNYFLDPAIRPWAGVDLSGLDSAINQGLANEQNATRKILRWDRSLMGVRSSPFNCVRAYLISEEIIKGDRKASDNPFRWDRVVFNLPGTKTYNPSRPWMYRWDDLAQTIASFVLSYVDDLRTGSSKGRRDCERVTHVAGSRLNYLGEQDATRKRGEAAQEPGAWAGSVIASKRGEGLYVSVSQEKWEKVKRIVDSYLEIIDVADKLDVPAKVNIKQLEKDTGFLVHVFMTYDSLRPYLKGFYLTMNSWRYNRGGDGWKYGKREWEELAMEYWQDGERWEELQDESRQRSHGKAAPSEVQIVPRFVEDLEILKLMFQNKTPSHRLVRGFNIVRIMYGFGDASGAGFGSSWITGRGKDEKQEVHYRFGRWGSDCSEESSNFRELRNLVDTMSNFAQQGELSGAEVFLFTDNSTAEAAFNRGSSSNKKLFEMVKEVRVMEMLFETRIHIVHVAGKRMIAQGTDGLSRGCLTDGVMTGHEMTSFVPLHLSALDRSHDLLPWLQYGSGNGENNVLEPLSPEDWFEKGQDIDGGTPNCDGVWTPVYRYGIFVWSPPPCVADQCMEELRRARHKRQRSTHVFVCPKIMSYAWQRQLFRSADVIVQIPAGHPAWAASQHESLLVGFYFPFLSHEPWQLKNADTVLAMARRLQRVCKANPSASGLVLRELWDFTRKLPNLPERVVQRLLQGTRHNTVPKTAARK
jgi:hypothetical protein